MATTKVEKFKPVDQKEEVGQIPMEKQILQDPASRNDLFYLLNSAGMSSGEIKDIIKPYSK